MSQSRKRLFKNLSDIDSPQKSAELHLAIESLSPIKESKSGIKYFDATVSDSTKRMRLVSFDAEIQQQLAKLHQNKTPIKLENCQVKQNLGRSDQFELHVNKATIISPSPKKIIVPDDETTTPVPKVALSDLWAIEEGKPVHITAKVTAIKPARIVKTGILQEICLDDDTGTTTLTVWGQQVNKLTIDTTYNFRKTYVRSYQNVKGVTLKRDSTYEESTVSIQGSQNDDNDSPLETVTNLYLIGVQYFNTYISCFNCSSKLSDTNHLFSRCTTCSVVQRLNIDDIQFSANLLFKDEHKQQLTFKSGTDIIKTILFPFEIDVANLSIIEEQLLQKQQPFSVSYNTKTRYITTVIECENAESQTPLL